MMKRFNGKGARGRGPPGLRGGDLGCVSSSLEEDTQHKTEKKENREYAVTGKRNITPDPRSRKIRHGY